MSGLPENRPHTLDELLFWLPSVLRRDELSEWERGFAVSILAASRRRNWKPTDKQARTLRRLVEAMFDPVELIDRTAA